MVPGPGALPRAAQLRERPAVDVHAASGDFWRDTFLKCSFPKLPHLSSLSAATPSVTSITPLCLQDLHFSLFCPEKAAVSELADVPQAPWMARGQDADELVCGRGVESRPEPQHTQPGTRRAGKPRHPTPALGLGCHSPRPVTPTALPVFSAPDPAIAEVVGRPVWRDV